MIHFTIHTVSDIALHFNEIVNSCKVHKDMQMNTELT